MRDIHYTYSLRSPQKKQFIIIFRGGNTMETAEDYVIGVAHIMNTILSKDLTFFPDTMYNNKINMCFFYDRFS